MKERGLTLRWEDGRREGRGRGGGGGGEINTVIKHKVVTLGLRYFERIDFFTIMGVKVGTKWKCTPKHDCFCAFMFKIYIKYKKMHVLHIVPPFTSHYIIWQESIQTVTLFTN